jgi:ankyrin repeat protein
MPLNVQTVTRLLIGLVMAYSFIGCSCNQGKIQPRTTQVKDAEVVFTSPTKILEGEGKNFYLSIQHKKGTSINLADYTVKLALTEVGGTGSTLCYTDATDSFQESPAPVVKSLTHLKTQAHLSSVSLKFTLQPQKDITRVIITAMLEHKDNNQHIPPVSIIWYQTTITETMIQDAQLAQQPLLADILQKLKNGQPVNLDQTYSQYTDNNQKLHLYNNNETALSIAAHMGNLDIVNALIERGANPSMPSSRYNAPLFNAIRNGHGDVAQALIKHLDPQQLNYINSSGETPLSLALSSNLKDSEEIVRALINKLGPERLLKIERQLDTSPLIYAINNGKIALAEFMISKLSKEQLAHESIGGDTPLMYAVRNNQVEIIKAIIDKLDKLQSESEEGPLYSAVVLRKKEAAEALIDALDKLDKEDCLDALHSAIIMNQEEIAKSLIDKLDSEQLANGINKHPQMIDHSNAYTLKKQIVKQIIDKLDKHLLPKDYTGYIPMVELIDILKYELAIKLINSVDSIVLHPDILGTSNQLTELISKKETIGEATRVAVALINKLNKEQLEQPVGNLKKTPLHFAVEYNKLEIVKELIAKGVNKDAKDANHLTPIEYAKTEAIRELFSKE